ncbi:unnamed protein product, partial [Heterosigma akashiwo]
LKKPYRGLAARHGVPKCFIMQVDESWLCPSYSAAVSPGRVVPPLPLAYGGAVAAGAADPYFYPCGSQMTKSTPYFYPGTCVFYYPTGNDDG